MVKGKAPGKSPKLVLKPRIIAGILSRSIGLIIIAVFYLFIFMPDFGILTAGSTTVISTGLILLVAIVVGLFVSYMNLRSRKYLFFDDKAEFYEGFLNIDRKVVRYDRVTDVSLRRPVWQRIWGTGSINLNTAGGPYRELSIGYIENPEDVYEHVQSLIKPGSTGTQAIR